MEKQKLFSFDYCEKGNNSLRWELVKAKSLKEAKELSKIVLANSMINDLLKIIVKRFN